MTIFISLTCDSANDACSSLDCIVSCKNTCLHAPSTLFFLSFLTFISLLLHSTSFSYIILTISSEVYKPCSTSLHSFLHSLAHFSLSGLSNLLITKLSNTLSLCSSITVKIINVLIIPLAINHNVTFFL